MTKDITNYLLWLMFFLPSLASSSPDFDSPRSCFSALNGKWLNLSSLSVWDFKSSCEYEFQGPNCNVKGTYWSSRGASGSLVIHSSQENELESCLSQGETSCDFSLEKSEMDLKCQLKPKLKLLSMDRSEDLDQEQKSILEAFDGNNSSQLKEILEKLSRKKNNEASAAIGSGYFHGHAGFQRDYSEALYWNRLAASQGNHQARILAGMQYLYGLGTKIDFLKAEAYFLPAAEEDDPVPQKALAGIYLMEKSTKKRRAKAKKWLLRASDLGDQQAKDFLDSLNPSQRAQLDKVCALISKDMPKELGSACQAGQGGADPFSHPITIINLPPTPPSPESSQRKLASGDPLADLAFYHGLERRFGVDFGLISPLGEFKSSFDGAALLGFHFTWEALPPFSLRLSTHRASSYHKMGQADGKLTVSQIGIGAQASFPQRRLIPFVKLEGAFAFNDVSFGSNKVVVGGNDTFVTTLGLNLGAGMDLIVGRELSFGVDFTFHYLMTKKVSLDDGSQFDVGSDYTSLALRVNF